MNFNISPKHVTAGELKSVGNRSIISSVYHATTFCISCTIFLSSDCDNNFCLSKVPFQHVSPLIITKVGVQPTTISCFLRFTKKLFSCFYAFVSALIFAFNLWETLLLVFKFEIVWISYSNIRPNRLWKEGYILIEQLWMASPWSIK